jgi:hypothetical protein
MCQRMLNYKSCTGLSYNLIPYSRFPAYTDSYSSRTHNAQITVLCSVNASDGFSHYAAFYYSSVIECLSQLISFVINPLAPELFFLNFAHTVFKMLIIREAN